MNHAFRGLHGSMYDGLGDFGSRTHTRVERFSKGNEIMRSIALASIFGFSIAVTPTLAGAKTPIARAAAKPIARAAAKQFIAKLP